MRNRRALADDNRTVRFLTFDCYGTLIDWREGIETNFKKFFLEDKEQIVGLDIFRRYVALEANEEEGYKAYYDVLRDTSLRLVKNLGVDPSESAAEKFAKSITHWPAFDDTAPTLKNLGRLGYKRVILSNIDRNLLAGTIRNNHLEVDDFITAQDVSSYKPAKTHWISFLRAFKVKRDELLHVANSVYHDIIPANELGLKTVWVNRYREPPPKKVRPSYVVDRLSGLFEILGTKQV